LDNSCAEINFDFKTEVTTRILQKNMLNLMKFSFNSLIVSKLEIFINKIRSLTRKSMLGNMHDILKTYGTSHSLL
jgi:hypothetical protein